LSNLSTEKKTRKKHTWKPIIHSKKMLGCFDPILGQIWTNTNVGLKNAINRFNPTAGFVHI